MIPIPFWVPARGRSRRGRMTWVLRAAGAGLGVVASACRPEPPRADTAIVGRGTPNPTDSLYKLYRAQLTAENPLLVNQQILCEYVRLDSLLGREEARRRTRAVEDSVYRWRDVAARQRVRAALGGHELVLSRTSCTPMGLARLRRPVADSLAVIAAREVAAGRSVASSCAFRCEFARLADHNLSYDDLIAQLRTGLAARASTRRLDPQALIDSVIFTPNPGCVCHAPE